MAAKEVLFSDDACHHMLADAVKQTLGPKGCNVILIYDGYNGSD
ncbi:hypothetical protein [Methylotuvimicrobium sp. KM1]